MNRLALLLLLFIPFSSVLATPVGPMSYQGRLLDSNGIPVTGSYNFVVKIYDDPTTGTLKYQETFASTAVDDGVYSLKVGSDPTPDVGTWDIALWQGNLNDLFLEIVVNGETLTPRHELTSAPHAFTSTFALSADALGNKTAAEFDNILEGICVASKGKWLELVEKCLGAGASFPGPTRVNWNTLTASNNFRDLDLTKADISGINFGSPSAAYLTGSIFTETTYSVAGMNGAVMNNTKWDGAIATDASPVALSAITNLAGTSMKNMNLSKWGMAAIVNSTYSTYFSAAYLSACPDSVFGYTSGTAAWGCKLMRAAGSDYFLYGPYVDFSTTSALAIPSNGGIILDLDADALDGTEPKFGKFTGVTFNQSFAGTNLYGANMSYARFENPFFSPSSLVSTNLSDTEFNGVKISGAPISGTGFSRTKMNHVIFTGYVNGANFQDAELKNVDFDGSYLVSSNLSNAILHNVTIDWLRAGSSNYTSLDGARISGDFFIRRIDTAAYNINFNNVHFTNATVSGALTDANFTGTLTFNNVVFRNLDLCSTVFPLVDTTAPHNDLAEIEWLGPVECPDGTDITGQYGTTTCDNTARMTETAVGNCTSGTP